MEFIKVLLLGLIEGITEWLPISSTGHLIILNSFLSLKASDAFISMFEVVIQLGAILAVVVLFFSKLWPFGKKNNLKPLKHEGVGSYIKTDIFVMWFKIIVACIPGILMIPFQDFFEEKFYNPIAVSLALIIFGVLFIVIERWNKSRKPSVTTLSSLSYKVAFAIGCFQLLAMIFPGTSRSGATILGALLLGVSRTVAAEFTFYLAIPVMFGASLLKLLDFGFSFTFTELSMLLLGMVVAFAVSIFVIKFLLSYIKKHDFTAFGWYRIVLGILVLLYFGLK